MSKNAEVSVRAITYDKELFTVFEASGFAAVSTRKVWEFLRDGTLTRVKLGNRSTRIRYSELLELRDHGADALRKLNRARRSRR